MERRFVDLTTTLSDGTVVKVRVIEDRCEECRDRYGAIFDALQAAVDEAEGLGQRPRLSAGKRT